MPVILSIGYRDFLMKNEAQAMAAMKALSTAVPMERNYEDRKETYAPQKDDDHPPIEIKIVKDNQIRAHVKPAKAKHTTIEVPSALPAGKVPLLLKFEQ